MIPNPYGITILTRLAYGIEKFEASSLAGTLLYALAGNSILRLSSLVGCNS